MKQIFALSQLLLCCPTLMAVSKKRGSTMEFHIFSKNVLWSWLFDNKTFLAKLSSNKVYMIPYKAQVSNPSGWGDTALPCPNLLSVYSSKLFIKTVYIFFGLTIPGIVAETLPCSTLSCFSDKTGAERRRHWRLKQLTTYYGSNTNYGAVGSQIQKVLVCNSCSCGNAALHSHTRGQPIGVAWTLLQRHQGQNFRNRVPRRKGCD